MKFVKLVKASEDWNVEKINENDWTIKSPDGMYKDKNDKEYHFKTKEDALEELDYLRAEHKFDKKSADNKKDEIIKDMNNLIKNMEVVKTQINEISDNDFEYLYNGLNYLINKIDEDVLDISHQLESEVDKIIDLAKGK